VYYDRALTYWAKSDFDKSISDYNKALELDPKLIAIYYERAQVYYYKKDYDQAWLNVHKAQELGVSVDASFIDELKKASGKDK